MKSYIAAALGATSALALALPANAQGQDEQGAAQTNGAQASQCMQDLRQLAETLQEDGYWLTGYRGYGTTAMGPTAGGRATTPGTAPPVPDQQPGELAVTPEATDTARDVPGASPWGNVRWEQRPQYEIGVLYEAAYVLANNGDEERCQTMVEATRDRYENYVAELEELGIDPQEVTDWRRAEIAASEPVAQMEGRFRADDIIGANVRNAQDDNLGSIDDVVLDPQTGAVQYVVVDYGGFLGLGSDEVVVPWERLRAMPGRNAFVLPVERAALEQAPTLPDDQGLFDTQQTGSIDTQEVDAYWDRTTDQQNQQ
ncbi:PRC-barrel domain-containing protein [Nitratireductor sp. GCM10026969]|uniref:PRC-barrel domain-containing protein n=1 Tax=Nitratireductor sp. GCM10026969 TaxID=3252645 RepID=UPI0036130499